MGEIRVSQREYAELLALKAKLEGGEPQKKTGAEVAGDALDFGKKVAKGYLAAGILLFAIGAACILPWMLRGFARLDAPNYGVRTQAERTVNWQTSDPVLNQSLNHPETITPSNVEDIASRMQAVGSVPITQGSPN